MGFEASEESLHQNVLSGAPLRIGITLGDPAEMEIVEAALASGKLDQAFEYHVIGKRGGARAGEPTPDTALAARAALEEAAALLDTGEIAAVVATVRKAHQP